MSLHQLITENRRNKQRLGSASIESTIERLSAADMPKYVPRFNAERAPGKIILGRIVATDGDNEQPVAAAHVDLYTVGSLKSVARNLPAAVLAHSRALLLESSLPIDLYSCGSHVADAPVVSFADVLQLREIPGYELLAAAAKSQPDASFKQLLCNNPSILKPLLCYYHPGSFPAVCAASTLSDAAGFFQFAVPQHGDDGEPPGFRFIVRRSISSSLYVTLYNPTPAAWHTHWDWPDHKSITLRTRHPLALRAQPPR